MINRNIFLENRQWGVMIPVSQNVYHNMSKRLL